MFTSLTLLYLQNGKAIKKFVQEGEDLGIRMQNAFQNGFDEGYENILLIGSDLPNISKEIID